MKKRKGDDECIRLSTRISTEYGYEYQYHYQYLTIAGNIIKFPQMLYIAWIHLTCVHSFIQHIHHEQESSIYVWMKHRLEHLHNKLVSRVHLCPRDDDGMQ